MDRSPRERCGSVEGGYTSPQNDDDREPKELLMSGRDVPKVNKALQAVPELERKILMLLYVPTKLSAVVQLKINRIPHRTCRERHATGVRMFWNNYKKDPIR